MKTALRWTLLAGLSALFATAAAGQTLYGIGYTGNNGLSTFYTIDPATGTASAVGAVGFERCSGMEVALDGTIYATCERVGDTPVLVTIDPDTGAGTEIGTTGISGAVTDLAFRADGTLFAYDGTNDPDHSLYTLNTATGAATLVGHTGLAFAGGNGLTFAGGVLYLSQFSGGPNSDLDSLNPANGTPTLLGQIAGVTGRYTAFTTHPVSGAIYGVENQGNTGSGPTFLETVNAQALTRAVIGATQNNLDAIAFGTAPPVVTVPTLGWAAMVGLILALAVAGAFFLGRR